MAAYDTAGNIISDAAVELGLGQIGDPYGSADLNIIQLRGLLKSAGRKLVFDRDWNHLTREYSFVTREKWAASTSYVAGGPSDAWHAGNPQNAGDAVTSNGNAWRCLASGTTGVFAPVGVSQALSDGVCTWRCANAGTASEVWSGGYYYVCAVSGISGSVGPQGTTVGATETDGGVTWTCAGLASDYALPPGFSNMIDQSGWNRTSRLPVGGPVDSQVWQYLKGRQQGIVFNVLFRDVAGVFRVYPDVNLVSGYNLAFEYITSYWASPASAPAPSADAPTLNTDLVYFDPLLMTRKLKLDWLGNKGFDTALAREEYEDILESVMNADGSAQVLSLRGPRNSEPLIGIANIPQTGIGQ